MVDAVGEHADADAAQIGVDDLVGEIGAGQLVGGVHQQGAEAAGGQQSARADGQRQLRVGGVADRVELAPADQQGGHEQSGQTGGDPVEDMVGVPVLGDEPDDVHHEERSGERDVGQPGGTLAAPHHQHQEDRERGRDQAAGGQVRREERADVLMRMLLVEELAGVVLVDLLAERQGEDREDVEHGDQPQVPHRGRGRAGA